jgi:hypothetical protein
MFYSISLTLSIKLNIGVEKCPTNFAVMVQPLCLVSGELSYLHPHLTQHLHPPSLSSPTPLGWIRIRVLDAKALSSAQRALGSSLTVKSKETEACPPPATYRVQTMSNNPPYNV